MTTDRMWRGAMMAYARGAGALLLSIVLVSGILGCGSGGSGVTSPNPTAQASDVTSSTLAAQPLDIGSRSTTIGQFTGTISPVSLWPPNHTLRTIRYSIKLDGNPVDVTGIVVYSNEDDVVVGTGDDHFSPDAKLVGQACQINPVLKLRSERLGAGSGRVYLIVFSTTGGVFTDTVVVTHSQSAADIAAVNNAAADALAYYNAHGVAPPGFVVVGDGPVIGPKQ